MLISCAGSRDGVVKVWSADANGVSGAAVAEMATHGSGVEHACVSGSGEATVSCGEDLALCAVREGGDVVLRLGDPESGERVSRRPFVRSFPSFARRVRDATRASVGGCGAATSTRRRGSWRRGATGAC